MSFKELTLADLAGPQKNAIVGGPFGSNLVSKDYVELGVPVVRGTNMGEKWVGGDFVFVSDEKSSQLSQNIARPGDLMFTQRGTLGQVSIVPSNKYDRYVVSQSQMKITVDPNKADVHFLYYLFNSPEQLQYIRNSSIQTGVPHTNLGILKKTPVKIPPLVMQKKIASILTALDDRITLLRETNTTLEAIAQALFKSWFVAFDPVHAKQQGREPEGMDASTAALFPDSFEESELGLVPMGWRVGKVADIGEVICGKTPPTSDTTNYGDDVPFITIPDMHNLLAVTSTNRSLSILGANTQKKKTLPAGSICVSCIATAGLVVRVTTPSQTNQQINSVVPFSKWGKSFPLFTLRRIGDAVRAGGSGGSVFHNLNKSGFEQLQVLFTSEHLALAFDDVVEPLIEKIIANQKQAQTLANLRDTLLPRLISGQLRLPDSTPA